MQKMLVVVFDDETKAYQGSSALKDLDSDGSISVHALAVAKKNPDGSLTTKDIDDDYPITTLEGTAIGALIGVLGGPVGLALGASSGLLAGSILDLDRADVNADYVDQVTTKSDSRQVGCGCRHQRRVGNSSRYKDVGAWWNRL